MCPHPFPHNPEGGAPCGPNQTITLYDNTPQPLPHNPSGDPEGGAPCGPNQTQDHLRTRHAVKYSSSQWPIARIGAECKCRAKTSANPGA